MAATQENADQTPEPSAAEQLSDENRKELALVFKELVDAIAENPEYQKKTARASLGGVSGLDSTGRPVTCELDNEDPIRVNYLVDLKAYTTIQILTVDQGKEGGFHADTRLNLGVTRYASFNGSDIKVQGQSATLVKGGKPVTGFQEIMAEARLFKEKFGRQPQAPFETPPPSPTKVAPSPLLVVRTTLPRR